MRMQIVGRGGRVLAAVSGILILMLSLAIAASAYGSRLPKLDQPIIIPITEDTWYHDLIGGRGWVREPVTHTNDVALYVELTDQIPKMTYSAIAFKTSAQDVRAGQTATLRLFLESCSSREEWITLVLYPIISAWDPNLITGENLPTTNDTAISRVTIEASGGEFERNAWLSIDVTSSLQGQEVYGLQIGANGSEQQHVACTFSSMQTPRAPELTLSRVSDFKAWLPALLRLASE